jgi:hypothetical protein
VPGVLHSGGKEQSPYSVLHVCVASGQSAVDVQWIWSRTQVGQQSGPISSCVPGSQAGCAQATPPELVLPSGVVQQLPSGTHAPQQYG